MSRIPLVADIHTHNPEATDAIINLAQGEEPSRPGAIYSVGWHPWWPLPADMEWVERMARHPQVSMIGECGIDLLRGQGSEAEQIALLRRHALLAEEVDKPLLLHCVRAWHQIMALRREMRPKQPWIIHGFRGKPELARQLLDAGFHISLGAKFNPDTEKIIPPDRLLRETD